MNQITMGSVRYEGWENQLTHIYLENDQCWNRDGGVMVVVLCFKQRRQYS